MRFTFIVLLLAIGCSSNKSMKQEISDTANQVDKGVRAAIEEVKDTSSKAINKLKTNN